ncbi:MAG TPA: TlpA disulfide reductase family protein [Polyangiaceae bacterium LLY-WYZ-15_(1-7)]|nr:TlpA disulfide reductase family protein [Polyangiaceae bacterium LLY-WYZ-15_(1-7)]HJL04998.1 TlpA disulfide reductase family protein [Polyangiaceae bacterium LLY-WYZ-15_(1-7)]HJL09348.1 TlpA disulfide reductase family protein [Polyangiaceae bacterium LLY-WYZ-15_(1-7)]HJL24254.1 TlpA disulfide reductase family protein [Polyangiaceae bacterium LLY-WYZ-15_(1-7)]HJL28244.1 TlpA disulfide reductase family protein [Polyangiaceae bacterium LLY-WYZ-15_(1-7)]
MKRDRRDGRDVTSERDMGADLKRVLPWLGGVLAIAALAALGLVPKQCGLGRAAPAFEEAIVAGEGVGDRVSLEALRGKVVLLDFWASWCPPCRESVPILNRLQARYPEGDVLLYGVNVEQEPAGFVERAHGALGIAFPTLHDPHGELQRAYDVQSYPTLFVIGKDGTVRDVEIGVADEAALGELVAELTAEQSP